MFIKLYAIAISVFIAIDMVWLGFVAKNFYSKHLGSLMAKEVNWPAALIFYLLFIAGLVFFVITPSLEKRSWCQVLLTGMFFGLITYATYDLTNLATLKNWPVIVTVVDLLWGMVLSGTVSVVSFFVAKKLGV
ncbi:DUF2177 family protein [Patescibacteria group bacterium]|nr:DUF2177 family protein [Patescibacteria group bacterium]